MDNKNTTTTLKNQAWHLKLESGTIIQKLDVSNLLKNQNVNKVAWLISTLGLIKKHLSTEVVTNGDFHQHGKYRILIVSEMQTLYENRRKFKQMFLFHQIIYKHMDVCLCLKLFQVDVQV